MGDPLIGNGGKTVFLDEEHEVPVRKGILPWFYCQCPHCLVRLEATTVVELRSKYLVHENECSDKREKQE